MNLFSSMKTVSTSVLIATFVAALLFSLGASGVIDPAPAVVAGAVTGIGVLFYRFFTGVSQMPTVGETKKLPDPEVTTDPIEDDQRKVAIHPDPAEGTFDEGSFTEDPLPEDTPHRSILTREENGVESIQRLLFIEDSLERESFKFDDLEELYLIGPKRAQAIRDWIYSAPEFY